MISIINKIELQLDEVLDDWSMMQKTSGDEGADWAERFEKNFYELIEIIKDWHHSLEQDLTMEELEQHPVILTISEKLPGPLQLNFQNELELIADDEEQVRFD